MLKIQILSQIARSFIKCKLNCTTQTENQNPITKLSETNQSIRLPGLKPGTCSRLILNGALYPVFKIWICRRRMYQIKAPIFIFWKRLDQKVSRINQYEWI